MWEQVNLLEINKGKSMGWHYHKATHEFFYVDKGLVKVFTSIIGSKENKEFEAKEGDCFVIGINEYHGIEAIKKSKLIVTLSKKYDQNNPDIHTGGLDGSQQ